MSLTPSVAQGEIRSQNAQSHVASTAPGSPWPYGPMALWPYGPMALWPWVPLHQPLCPAEAWTGVFLCFPPVLKGVHLQTIGKQTSPT